MGRRKAFLVTGLGLEMLLSPVIGLMGGAYLDKWWNTTPWLLIVGLILGILSAIRIGAKLYRIGMKSMNSEDQK